jgi:hypothetical protein
VPQREYACGSGSAALSAFVCPQLARRNHLDAGRRCAMTIFTLCVGMFLPILVC